MYRVRPQEMIVAVTSCRQEIERRAKMSRTKVSRLMTSTPLSSLRRSDGGQAVTGRDGMGLAVPGTENHQGAARDVAPKEGCAKLGLSQNKKMVLYF
ncbi:hypothetical protein E2C01_084570 [Portunus trituberculatus]|uniref:Uncharacterized protein n=1 Tax=Portunus trituberculatus TaxID=210409 RepID=A0A5B7J6N1_PORTR|nr:hypothetical protein [Portunus trituberculatus]